MQNMLISQEKFKSAARMIQSKLRLSEAAYRYQIQFNHRHPCSVVDYVTNFLLLFQQVRSQKDYRSIVSISCCRSNRDTSTVRQS